MQGERIGRDTQPGRETHRVTVRGAPRQAACAPAHDLAAIGEGGVTGWVIFVGAASLVGWVASRHGRGPILGAAMALIASGVTSALAVHLATALVARSESAALATVVLAPLLGLVAVVAVGLLAARPVPPDDAVAPAVESTPEEVIPMVQLPSAPRDGDGGSPYRTETRCRLVLGARMLTLEGETPARSSLAYRLVAASAADPDVLRLAWTNRHGEDVVVLLRPADVDADQRAEIVGAVIRRVAARDEEKQRV